MNNRTNNEYIEKVYIYSRISWYHFDDSTIDHHACMSINIILQNDLIGYRMSKLLKLKWLKYVDIENLFAM